MWLYRVVAMNPNTGDGVFYDATSSIQDAIHFASQVKRREPQDSVTIEAEHWPKLSWLVYKRHQLLGTHEGFGVNFKTKHSLQITEFKTVWPK